MPKRNILLLLATCLACLAAWAAREQGGHGRRFGEVMAAIERRHLEPANSQVMFDAAVDAAVARLDEHSAYLRGDGRAELETALDLVPNTPKERPIDIVLSNSFGFGGTNASIVFRRHG